MSVTIDSNPTSAYAMFATITGGTVHLDCPHFEQVVGSTYFGDAFAVSGTLTVLQVRGQIMSQVRNGRGIVHSGGSSRFTALLIDTSGTTVAVNYPVWVSAAGLILDQCKLIAPASSKGIYGPVAGQTLTCYDVKATQDVDANVSNVYVDLLKVDSHVT